jgi:predicted RNA-binding Zn ribbon-like protein
MTKSSRPEAYFVADHLALDFLNSIAAPSGTEFEWLADGHDLLSWLENAKLVPTNILKSFRENTEITTLNSIAEQARELREWFRLYVKRNAGTPIQTSYLEELNPINQILKNDNCYRQLNFSSTSTSSYIKNPSQFYLLLNRQWNTTNSLLIPLAEIIADLLCQTDFSQVKNCEGSTCTLWFNDISKNHGRRWCSMAVCGNRAKAAAHRAKKQTAQKKK